VPTANSPNGQAVVVEGSTKHFGKIEAVKAINAALAALLATSGAAGPADT
jgi:hypothetical protein